MSSYDFIIDGFTWSFSRVNSFCNCKREWYMKYIESEKGENSFFAQFGTLCHEVLEDYFNGNISVFDMPTEYDSRWQSIVTLQAPYNKYSDIGESYYKKGLEYFEEFEFNHEKYEILGVEKPIDFEVGNHNFVGYIDLLLRERDTRRIIILDHKSAEIQKLKKGGIAKKDVQHFIDFKRQLYLYAKPIIEEYGHVDELRWNMFRVKDWLIVDFNEDEYKEALEWAEKTIGEIYEEEEFPPKVDERVTYDYYCSNLCSDRLNCPYRPRLAPKEEV